MFIMHLAYFGKALYYKAPILLEWYFSSTENLLAIHFYDFLLKIEP